MYYYILSIIAVVGFCFSTVEANEKNNKSEVNSVKELMSLFKNPPIEYGSAPLWVWNDDVTKEQIDQQLIDFKEGGMGGVFIHPRPGLITSYLSDEWFSLCAYTVKKGKELGMNVWLYDENSYPSGFAGGHVPAEMPESYNLGQGLILKQFEILPENANDYYLILKKHDSEFIDITDEVENEKNKTGDYYLYEKSYYEKLPWHGGYSYVDLLKEGVTEKFIELTMTGYEKYIGGEFGQTVPGIFTDEPNISSPGGIRWTPSLFIDFEKRWGYDLKTNLPSLTYEIGNWQRVRHNYYAMLLELFIERWSKPWYNYCEKNNLIWTGHYWEHGWPYPHHGGDNMAMYAWHQMPAIDILMNQYSEDVNAQFGNVRAVKELSSVANQMGRTRTLSETYGAGGWDLSFEDMKRIGDWEYVLGVNFMNQHLSYMTLEGARKRDHPQSFSYHEPWWKHYNTLGDYFARLSLALSSGKQINRILVIEPTSTAWMYYSETQSNNKIMELGPLFQEFVLELEKYQIEYDLASENIIKDIGDIRDEKFVVGERDYEVVVIPPGLDNLDKPTLELLTTYLKQHGKVISFNATPSFIDGGESTELKLLVDQHKDQWLNINSITDHMALDIIASKSILFKNPELIKGKLFHHRRELDEGQLLFLVNTSSNEWSDGSFNIKGKSVDELDLMSGEIKPYHSETDYGMLSISFELPPSGSLLLMVTGLPSKSRLDQRKGKTEIITTTDKVKIKRTAANVLSLDYCDIKYGNKIEKDIYYSKAADVLFKHHGFKGNPWSSAVQYKTSIIDRNIFANDSGFEASYSFIVDDDIDKKNLHSVVEHPELWSIYINDNIVETDTKSYWLDRKYGVYDIGKHVVDGENNLKLIANQMSVHSELEPVYILGNFSLEPLERGWKLIAAKSLKLGSWNEQGLPFYSEAVSYTKTYNIIAKNKLFIVKLTDWRGSVAHVMVNNKSAGIIAWPPYELDITNHISEGENEISIIVNGTLKNVLGPHHIGPVRGTAWPASFESAQENLPSGNDYDFIEYGLFKDFVVLESDGPPQKVYWRIVQSERPIFDQTNFINFTSPFTVSISTQTDGAEIRYTLDGSKPDENSNLYIKPLRLNKSITVNAKSFHEGMVPSKVVQRNFYFIDKEKNGIKYNYYEGDWQKLPEFNSLDVIRNGKIYDFNLNGFERRAAKFAVEFIGYIKIEYDGEYTFYTSSNDGTKLFIGNELIVDNDGSHGDFEKQGKIKLDSGMHVIKVEYFDSGGSQALKVLYKGPGISRQLIPPDKLFTIFE